MACAGREACVIFGELCDHMHLSGQTMLSVLIVEKDRQIPGLGFFGLSVALGERPAGRSEEDNKASRRLNCGLAGSES